MRLTATALLLSLSLAVAAEERSLIGYWVNPDDPDDSTSFEKDRAITLDHGTIQYWMARYTPGKVVLGWLGEASLPYHWQGDDIIIDVPKKPEWHRVTVMPASLKEPVFAIPKPKDLSAARIQEISDAFTPRITEDQAVRKDPSRTKDMAAVDHDNTAWLKKLVLDVGWIDGTRFGKQTAGSAFLLVQHSGDLPLMQATLPLIKADLSLGVCDPQDFALLYDRVQIMTGRRQRYGSQIGQAFGKNALFPLENREKVDEFRSEIGLFPLETYLKVFGQMMKTEIGYMDDMPVAGMPSPVTGLLLEPLIEADAPALAELYRSIGMIGIAADGSEITDQRPWIRTLNSTLIGRKLVVDGVLVGGGQLTVQKQKHVYELGYWVGLDQQSRGYGTAIARLFAELAFTQLPCHRLWAKTSSRHAASIRVLEKSGFRREGVLRDVFMREGAYYDEVHYGMLATEWRAVPAAAP